MIRLVRKSGGVYERLVIRCQWFINCWWVTVLIKMGTESRSGKLLLGGGVELSEFTRSFQILRCFRCLNE